MIIKPDGVVRGLMGEVLRRFENVGLKVVGLKFGMLDKEKIWKHYGKDDAWFLKKGSKIAEDRKNAGMVVDKEPIEYGKDIIRALEKFMTTCPVLSMVLEGNQAVAVVKKMVGETEPSTSGVGTIRGDLTLDSYQISAVDDRAVRNLIHCSDEVDNAKAEIALWLDEKELHDYRIISEAILYDVNLDGIME